MGLNRFDLFLLERLLLDNDHRLLDLLRLDGLDGHLLGFWDGHLLYGLSFFHLFGIKTIRIGWQNIPKIKRTLTGWASSSTLTTGSTGSD